MATRGRHTRDGEGPSKEFTGRVHRWARTWVAAKQPRTKELKFRRWLQTGAPRWRAGCGAGGGSMFAGSGLLRPTADHASNT